METLNRAAKETRRRPGPKPKVKTQQYALMLEPAPAEWGKDKPGGLSELVRRLLREAYEHEGQKEAVSE